MTAYPKVRLRRPATAIVSLTIVFAASFPYMFVGPVPVWIACGLLCLGLTLLNRRFYAIVAGRKEVVVALGSWILLLVVTLILDLMGLAERDVMSGPALSSLTLLTFTGALVASFFANQASLRLVLILVAAFQGAVSTLQFFGVPWAWDLADSIANGLPFLAKVDPETASEAATATFSDFGRVRGTHLFIHVYNGIQSSLVAFSLYMLFHSTELNRGSRIRKLYSQLAVVVSTVGLLLSFSRSGVIALAGAMLLILLIRPSARRIVLAVTTVAVLWAVLEALRFTDSVQFARLLNYDSDAVTNQTRLDHLAHAVSNFTSSPVIGASGLQGASALDLPIHSVPMRYLNDYGAIGFVLYFSVLIPIVVLFARNVRSRIPEVAAWAGSGLCVVLAVVSDSWTHSSGLLRRDVFHAVILAVIAGSMLAIRSRNVSAAVSIRSENFLQRGEDAGWSMPRR